MTSFNRNRDLKTPSFQQNPQTLKSFFNISTKNNINIVLAEAVGTFTFRAKPLVSINTIPGYTNGIANGTQVQTIGDGLWETDVNFTLYGNYQPVRNSIIKLLQSGEAFAIKGFTTQTQQTIATIMPNASGKNYVFVKPISYSFKDEYIGLTGADEISATFQVLPFEVPKKSKKSFFQSLFSVAGLFDIFNKLDQFQTILSNATLQVAQTTSALQSISQSIGSFGSGVGEFAKEVNNFNTQIGTLSQTPTVLISNIQNLSKSFGSIFTNGDKTTQNKYISVLKDGFTQTKAPTLQTTFINAPDGSKIYIHDNIMQNITAGRSYQFLRMILTLTVANIYQNYTFETIDEAKDAFFTLQAMFVFIASDNSFENPDTNANLPTIFKQNSIEPQSFLDFEEFVLQSLESIRQQMQNINPYRVVEIITKTTLYNFVAYQYGSLDNIDIIASINSITDYTKILQNISLKVL